MKKGVFEIDFMHDDLAEDCTKEDVVNLVRKMYDDYFNEEVGAEPDDIEIEVVDMEIAQASPSKFISLIMSFSNFTYRSILSIQDSLLVFILIYESSLGIFLLDGNW